MGGRKKEEERRGKEREGKEGKEGEMGVGYWCTMVHSDGGAEPLNGKIPRGYANFRPLATSKIEKGNR